MLIPGLYEQVINKGTYEEILKLSPNLFTKKEIDKEESSQIISAYLCDVVKKGFDNIIERKGSSLADQITLANKIIDLVKKETEQDSYDEYAIDLQAEQLLAVMSKDDPKIPQKDE